MKNIYIILLCLTIYALSSSCEEMFGDFLDKAPGVDVTSDTIFSAQRQCETFIAGMYSWGTMGQQTENDERMPGTGFWAGASDEGEETAAWFFPNSWNAGNVTPENNLDIKSNTRWISIRKANILLEKINDVKDADQSYKDIARGEALFIRALNYFDLFKFFGGIPIVDKSLTVDDQYYIPRSSVKEIVDFIVKDCSEAASLLPNVWATTAYGRATKGAALILKAKVLLYAASPLFNSVTPYLDLPGHNDLLCYGTSDNNRWQLAADAAKAVLDWAPSGGIALVTNFGTDKNYKAVWEKPNNSEIILTHNIKGLIKVGQPPIRFLRPPVFYTGLSGITVPLNFVKFYRKNDGTPQTWNMAGGNDLNQKYADMEQRFKQTFAYNLSYWNVDFPVVQLWQADPANKITAGAHLNKCTGGVWMHKFLPDALRQNVGVYPFESLFRLAEAYLYYAEALNEAQGPIPAAYDAINAIRNRSGLPNLTPGLTKEQFRVEVRLEFTIEMAYDDHRFWNLRRWMTAEEEGVMKGNMYGIKIYRIIPATNPVQYRYVPYVFESRVFHRRFYLHPFPQSEVNKNYIIQNPGY